MEIQSTNLPISHYKQSIINTVHNNTVTLICGETGSGKTTQVPQYLLPYYSNIMISQPRRISAISLAQRVAKEHGCQIGSQIGYSVRFDEKRSSETRVIFVTDGMAIREMMVGRKYDLYVIDEAHERSINTDVLLAVLKGMLQKNTNKRQHRNIKLIIMSATIDVAKFCRFFNTDAVIKIKGRTYPTMVMNLLQPTSDYMVAMFNTILQIHCTQKPGDILAFLTGEDEIITMRNQLNSVFNQSGNNEDEPPKYQIQPLEILILYSALPYEYHMAIFKKDPLTQVRRVILSTNIAESSVTIPGVRYVVDCGFMKVRLYQPQQRIEVLTVVPVSKANAEQRAGRAGREDEGKCFRLYIQNDYEDLPGQMVPEILRSDLSGPFLQLKAIGVPNLRNLQYIDKPSQQYFQHSLTLLQDIGCLSSNEHITEKGFEVSKLPVSPTEANLLLLSIEHHCEEIMLSLISILSVDNLFYVDTKAHNSREHRVSQVLNKFKVNKTVPSDHLIKVNILHQYVRTNNKKSFCKENHINSRAIKRAVEVRQQIAEYLTQIITERQKKSFSNIKRTVDLVKNINLVNSLTTKQLDSFKQCLQKGYLYSVAKLQKCGKYLISKTNQLAVIHPQSSCFSLKIKPSIVVFSQIVKTSKLYIREITVIQD